MGSDLAVGLGGVVREWLTNSGSVPPPKRRAIPFRVGEGALLCPHLERGQGGGRGLAVSLCQVYVNTQYLVSIVHT